MPCERSHPPFVCRALTDLQFNHFGERNAGLRLFTFSRIVHRQTMAPPKSPAQPNLRRSSRASTPTQRATSPRLHNSTSTPSLTSQLLSASAPGPPPSVGSVRKSHSSRALSPSVTGSATRGATTLQRPALPVNEANKQLTDKHKVHKVKLQTLHLGPSDSSDETITIARVKCQVPKGVPG